jgi:hypothetical protein
MKKLREDIIVMVKERVEIEDLKNDEHVSLCLTMVFFSCSSDGLVERWSNLIVATTTTLWHLDLIFMRITFVESADYLSLADVARVRRYLHSSASFIFIVFTGRSRGWPSGRTGVPEMRRGLYFWLQGPEASSNELLHTHSA